MHQIMKLFLTAAILFATTFSSMAQGGPDEDQLGSWYMYFFQKKIKNSQFGIQGDYQLRLWNVGTDLEQLLLRTGVTYTPKNANITFTAGFANITTGQFGEGTNNVNENRVYQEALIPQKVGNRFYLTHRMRYEQRWVQNQDFRTRYRYNLFLNVPLNATELKKGTVYAALYNEIFINGQRNIGNNRTVELFDRNRTYLGLGFGLKDNLRVQGGWMKQTTNNWAKGQTQISLHHNF
jgi:hypothetical protein